MFCPFMANLIHAYLKRGKCLQKIVREIAMDDKKKSDMSRLTLLYFRASARHSAP
jgi:hypothetical protein